MPNDMISDVSCGLTGRAGINPTYSGYTFLYKLFRFRVVETAAGIEKGWYHYVGDGDRTDFRTIDEYTGSV